MGSCQSTDTTAMSVEAAATAMVITAAGGLREFGAPVAASDVLGAEKAACVVCSSDRLYCDDYITALDSDELLQPGQLYFVLPAAKLRFRLSGEDMAALAVTASLALGLLGEGTRRRGKGLPVEDLKDDLTGGADKGLKARRCEEKVGRERPPVVAQRRMKRIGSMRAGALHRHGRHPRTRLSTIPEVEETTRDVRCRSLPAKEAN